MQLSTSDIRPLWRQLAPGAYGCGFKSLWQFDHGRTYNMEFDDGMPYAVGKSPRPILINLWYPTESGASQKPMDYGDYLHLPLDRPELDRFGEALARFARAAIVNEVFHIWGETREEAKLTAAEQEALRMLLEAPTAAYRDAPVAEGRFPLIVYMGGAGSSFEDSSVLCEYLASHGYVVIGSAYQTVDGSSLGVGGGARAAGDIRYLVSYTHDLPYVDWNHVGMFGHSLGAQAGIMYQAEPGCVVDAMVSLDTTQDRYPLSFSGWEYMKNAVKEGAARMTRPVMFVANPNAGFALAESMTSTPRYLLTLDGLHHDDFILHGSLDRRLKVALAASEERAAAEREADLVCDRYTTLCETVLRFMDATLKGDPTALNAQVAKCHAGEFRGDQPYLDVIPPGAESPKPYLASDASAPSPRQVRQILRTAGAEATVAALLAGWEPEPWEVHIARRWRYPACDTAVAFSLIYDLMVQGKSEEAKTLYHCYRQIGRQAGWPEGYVKDSFLGWGWSQDHRACVEYLLVFEPENEEAIQELKRLDETAPDAGA